MNSFIKSKDIIKLESTLSKIEKDFYKDMEKYLKKLKCPFKKLNFKSTPFSKLPS